MQMPFKPYYAVIFSSELKDVGNDYVETTKNMLELAKQQQGYLGFESARSGYGISVSYWESLEAISKWKQKIDHQIAIQKGRTKWYKWYKVRICKIEREYEFTA